MDEYLTRALPDWDAPEVEPLPFGSQEAVISRLCAHPGFKLYGREQPEEGEPQANVVYIEKNEAGIERDTEFVLLGDPVTDIAIASGQSGIPGADFQPIIAAFSELAPFAIFDALNGEILNLSTGEIIKAPVEFP